MGSFPTQIPISLIILTNDFQSSSAIQILPAILPHVERVINFIRTPAWITTPFGNSSPRQFAQEEIQHFRDSPDDHLALRKEVEATNNGFFKMFLQGTLEQKASKKFYSAQMAEVLGYDEVLCKALIPQWSLGCRRLTPGVGYLQAIKDPKVTIVREALTGMNQDSAISASGQSHQIDVLICASGFNTVSILSCCKASLMFYRVLDPGIQSLDAMVRTCVKHGQRSQKVIWALLSQGSPIISPF
jgi:cation diffusion facilitator CzcD-associated flavoprotein CzcO